ncbi:MAG: T9SS type A sorting domain-containing protein [Ignavibacteriaceae bacterium]
MKYLIILIVCSNTLFLSEINAQWSNSDFTLTGRQILCFAKKDLSVLAGTNGGLVLSTNNGQSWSNTGGGLPYTNVRALLKVESYPFNVLAGMVSGRISMSTNFGENFSAFPYETEQLPFLADVNTILERENSSNFLVGTERGVYLLPQFYPLSSWVSINTGLPSSETKVRAIIENNGEIFAGTNSGVFQLNGYDWVERNTGLTNLNVTALASADGYLFAGTSQGSIGGVYISSDNGGNWTLSKPETWVTSFLIVGSNLFEASMGNGITRSTNYGISWIPINDGLGSGAYNVLSLGADDQYLFAGTNGSSIWRRPLSEIVTETEVEVNTQPTNFVLEQNYPNPFNPSTIISYQLPLNSEVILKVYDILGNEVATLVDEFKLAGTYEIDFNALQLSSGLYLYKLQTGEFVSTKKMILIK